MPLMFGYLGAWHYLPLHNHTLVTIPTINTFLNSDYIYTHWWKLEQRHLMYVRRMLDEHGMMDAQCFDEKMWTLHLCKKQRESLDHMGCVTG